MSFSLRCHRCSAWLGESRQPMKLVGIFEKPRQVERIEGPRDTWRCKGCGWANVFEPAEAQDWRTVELKHG